MKEKKIIFNERVILVGVIYKDVNALIRTANSVGYHPELIAAVDGVNERQKQADTNVKFKKIKSYEIPSEEQNKIIQQTISKANYHRDIVRRKQYTKKSTKKRLIKNKAINKKNYLNKSENSYE